LKNVLKERRNTIANERFRIFECKPALFTSSAQFNESPAVPRSSFSAINFHLSYLQRIGTLVEQQLVAF
jgi:hypothetical protein